MIETDTVTGIRLPYDFPVFREEPRPAEFRQSDYSDKFDHRTLFCDAFWLNGDIVLSGPALLNLRSALQVAEYSLNGVVPLSAQIDDLWKTQRSRLTFDKTTLSRRFIRRLLRSSAVPAFVRIKMGGRSFSLPIGDDGSDRFANRRVLFTLQKNNRLEWIKDWVTFYRRVHGIDAVIIYDNDSDGYTIDDVADVVARVDGIEVAQIVSWPFPYGPGAPRADMWDSDFCQYTALEHMRWKYSRKADALINADIDELVVCSDGRSLLDHLNESKDGILYYQCNWVESVYSGSDPDTRRHRDFIYRSKERKLGTRKWSLAPRRMPKESQFRVHTVTNGKPVTVDEGIRHRHFFGINTSWKRDSESMASYDPGIHYIDDDLVKAMGVAFP